MDKDKGNIFTIVGGKETKSPDYVPVEREYMVSYTNEMSSIHKGVLLIYPSFVSIVGKDENEIRMFAPHDSIVTVTSLGNEQVQE